MEPVGEEREEVVAEVQVFMRRGGGEKSLRQARAETLIPTCSSWVFLLGVELFTWVRTQDTTKTWFPGGVRPPTRISEPKAPAGGGWGDQREGAALTI